MKRLLIVCLMLAAVVPVFADSEELDMYAYLYNQTRSYEEQLGLLQGMGESGISGAGEFYAQALRRLVSGYVNISNATDQHAVNEQAVLLAKLLSDEGYKAAGPDLWLVAENFTEPLVQAEALMALGNVRAAEFLPQVIKVLVKLNAGPTPDRLNGERQAFGAIIALEKYQDPSGYLPVYFASTGWYGERIKNQALKSLAVIAPDPAPHMIEIIRGSGYNYPTRLAALQNIEKSSVSNESKSSVAVAALAEGWRGSTNNVQERMNLARMRKMSIDMIQRYGVADNDAYPHLERCYKEGIDDEEKLSTIKTLGILATEESAKRLSSFLMDLNGRLQSGTLTRNDESMVRAIIPALGTTKRTSARPALSAVNALNWTPAVKTLAQEALKQIP